VFSAGPLRGQDALKSDIRLTAWLAERGTAARELCSPARLFGRLVITDLSAPEFESVIGRGGREAVPDALFVKHRRID
jgi:hypothetical protein